MKSNKYLEELGALIKKHRLKQGFTQEELSFRCTIHRNEISLIERAQKDIKLSTLLKLLLYLDVPTEKILKLKLHFILDTNN